MPVSRHRIDAQDCPCAKGCRARIRRSPAQSRVPLRRKRPAGTQGSGDIDEPSAVTDRARSIGDRAASEIDAPRPRLTPTCGGRTRRPRTEEWPLPDNHPRSRRQLEPLDPRSPITEEGSTTVPLPPPVASCSAFFFSALRTAGTARMRPFPENCPNHGVRQQARFRVVLRLSRPGFADWARSTTVSFCPRVLPALPRRPSFG